MGRFKQLVLTMMIKPGQRNQIEILTSITPAQVCKPALCIPLKKTLRWVQSIIWNDGKWIIKTAPDQYATATLELEMSRWRAFYWSGTNTWTSTKRSLFGRHWNLPLGYGWLRFWARILKIMGSPRPRQPSTVDAGEAWPVMGCYL